MEVLKDQMRNRKIDYADISQPDPQNNPDHIVDQGCAASIALRLAEHRAGSTARVRRHRRPGEFLEYVDEAYAA